MNVNQLLHDHQVASLMAQHAHLRVDREAYGEHVGERAQRITDWRKSAGLSAIGWSIEPTACRSDGA
jgi:thiamine monophosphate synthase